MCIQGVKKTIFIDGYITLQFQVSYVTFNPENGIKLPKPPVH